MEWGRLACQGQPGKVDTTGQASEKWAEATPEGVPCHGRALDLSLSVMRHPDGVVWRGDRPCVLFLKDSSGGRVED